MPTSGLALQESASYPTHLQQMQTISTNPAHPNVLLMLHISAAILTVWLGTQAYWGVELK